MAPFTAWCELPACTDGMIIHAGDSEITTKFGAENVCHEMADDAICALNLLTLLGLSNIKTEVESAPEKLQKSRRAKGKMPLYSYHILSVDGVRNDKSIVPMSSGKEFRSHIRRGHIRRIDHDRRVWVRPCFVHGRIDGFVDKDYVLNRKVSECLS